MSQEYEVVVGLEIHAELCTRTKLFCGCQNAFGAPPNTLCCPVCAGLPGALPVLNGQAVEDTVLLGLALHCDIERHSWMDRKQYFYPDLPKAYQITQYEKPLCKNGYLDVQVGAEVRRIEIERIQLEEDAGKLLYPQGTKNALLDLNRCGVPLVEIVSRPQLRGAAEAKSYMEGIAAVLRYLGISDVKMQEGSLRADVNVSLRPVGQTALGPRTEMKNINSFGAVYRAIVWEAERQRRALQAGERLCQQTRRWDDVRGEGMPLRDKETAQDYRFFPEPDLPPVEVSEEMLQRLVAKLPELPLAKQRRYTADWGLNAAEARQLTATPQLARFFEACVEEGSATPHQLANWLLGDVARHLRENHLQLAQTALTPKALCALAALVQAGEISGTAGKKVLAVLLREDADPAAVARRLGLTQIRDADSLQALLDKVLAAHSGAVADLQNGKADALEYLLGQCMRASGGRADPQLLRRLLRQTLGGKNG